MDIQWKNTRLSDNVTYQGLMEALHLSSYNMGVVCNEDMDCRNQAIEVYATALLELETFMDEDRRMSLGIAYQIGKGEIK